HTPDSSSLVGGASPQEKSKVETSDKEEPNTS
ncbi:recombinase XerC, partial [Leptospira santarosai]|nr:recombinase XerC [Leptospira santarosai]